MSYQLRFVIRLTQSLRENEKTEPVTKTIVYRSNVLRRFFTSHSCRYGSRTSSSSGREIPVDDEDEDEDEDEREKIFFVWLSSLDCLPFDLLSIGNGPAAVPFSHDRKFLLPLLQGRGD